MKQLIVNADDFGLTSGVNQGIVEAHRNGILSSTTLMANGDAYDMAVAMGSACPGLGIGVHLNLTQGRPVARTGQVSTLVNRNGSFCLTAGQLARRAILRRVSLSEVERELRAQIERVLASGLRPTHLDGHKHFHAIPAFFNIIATLARSYQIPAIRRVAETTPGLLRLLSNHPGHRHKILRQFLAGLMLSWLSAGSRHKLRMSGLKCPDYLLGITQTGYLDREVLFQLFGNLPDGTGELMCHPGYPDNDLMRLPTRLLEQRRIEVEALTSAEIKKELSRRQIRIVNYREFQFR